MEQIFKDEAANSKLVKGEIAKDKPVEGEPAKGETPKANPANDKPAKGKLVRDSHSPFVEGAGLLILSR